MFSDFVRSNSLIINKKSLNGIFIEYIYTDITKITKQTEWFLKKKIIMNI